MKRLAISSRLEGLLNLKSEKTFNEKRNISPEEFQKQANYIKTSIRDSEYSSHFEFPNFTADDFLHLFCKVCSKTI